jgi:hypothetical protein
MGKLMACAVFVFFLVPVLGAQVNDELKLADAYYDLEDYSRAYVHYQNLILKKTVSGDILYRYGSCREQIRGPDEATLNIYALAGQYRASPEDTLLEELRGSIDAERRAYLYNRDAFHLFTSKFSVFQWKIIASIVVTIPFLIGMMVLGRGGENRRPKKFA